MVAIRYGSDLGTYACRAQEGGVNSSVVSYFLIIFFNLFILVSFCLLASLITKTKNTMVKKKENYNTKKMYGVTKNSVATPVILQGAPY